MLILIVGRLADLLSAGSPGLPGQDIQNDQVPNHESQHRRCLSPDEDAGRITRLGKILRATSVDELPRTYSMFCAVK